MSLKESDSCIYDSQRYCIVGRCIRSNRLAIEEGRGKLKESERKTILRKISELHMSGCKTCRQEERIAPMPVRQIPDLIR